jgi:hypothetical protein
VSGLNVHAGCWPVHLPLLLLNVPVRSQVTLTGNCGTGASSNGIELGRKL